MPRPTALLSEPDTSEFSRRILSDPSFGNHVATGQIGDHPGWQGLHEAGLSAPCNLGEWADQPNDQRIVGGSVRHNRYVRYKVFTLS